MIKASIELQDLRRRIYVKAKAESSWRFGGLYVQVCKRETLGEAYRLAKKKNGAPGIDGVTFEAIEGRGVEAFLGELQTELIDLAAAVAPQDACHTALVHSLRIAAQSYEQSPICCG